MAAETMPERIWANVQRLRTWLEGSQCGGTEYIRADLCVLASTHQRVIEALREAEKNCRLRAAKYREEAEVISRDQPTTMLERQTARHVILERSVAAREADAIANDLRAALAAIKEHTP